jgi:hypothetical protein
MAAVLGVSGLAFEANTPGRRTLASFVVEMAGRFQRHSHAPFDSEIVRFLYLH